MRIEFRQFQVMGQEVPKYRESHQVRVRSNVSGGEEKKKKKGTKRERRKEKNKEGKKKIKKEGKKK